MKNISVFHLKIFSFLEVKFTIYLNRRVFVMEVPKYLDNVTFYSTFSNTVKPVGKPKTVFLRQVLA